MQTTLINQGDNCYGGYVNHESEQQSDDDIFNEIKIKTASSIFKLKRKYPNLFDCVKSSVSLNDL
ncbi:TPA: hypothetical protein U5E22_001657, partial [Yersinia enterocolitica]|nr:hypothetical protein [Yersinia enterocolitica]